MKIIDYEVDETGEYLLDEAGARKEYVVVDEGDWSVIVFYDDGRIEALTMDRQPQDIAPYNAIAMGAVLSHIIKDEVMEGLIEDMHTQIESRRGTLQ